MKCSGDSWTCCRFSVIAFLGAIEVAQVEVVKDFLVIMVGVGFVNVVYVNVGNDRG